MTMFFSVCCFAIAFTPALMLFKRVVMSDPLRIILFVLGAFFWLLSLLVTSLVWAVTGNYSLLIAVLSSILVQEVFRGLYYYLLYKAQGGLSKLATDGVEVSGVRLMYSSRHVLAIVCGLGMGVMAALVLLTNILADYADDGVVGLPAEMNQTDPGHHTQQESKPQQQLRFEDAYFPLYYSLSCALLTLFNVVWTINLWDGLHKVFHKYDGLWYVSVALTLLYHWVNTILVSSARQFA